MAISDPTKIRHGTFKGLLDAFRRLYTWDGTTLALQSSTITDSTGISLINDFEFLNHQTTAVGNVGSGEDDLMTYTLPAGELSTDNDALVICGTFTTNGADSCATKFYFGSSGALFNLGPTTSGPRLYLLWLMRDGATSQKIGGYAATAAGGGPVFADTAETLSNSLVIKFTGQNSSDTSDNAIVQETMTIWKVRAQ